MRNDEVVGDDGGRLSHSLAKRKRICYRAVYVLVREDVTWGLWMGSAQQRCFG